MNVTKYPVKVKDITKFKKQNSPEVSVNLFGYEENKVYLLRSSEVIKTHHLNLLYITEGENGHYILTKDLSKLVSSQYTKSNGRLYICPYCLNSCKTQIILDNYQKGCKYHGAQRIYLPSNKRCENSFIYIILYAFITPVQVFNHDNQLSFDFNSMILLSCIIYKIVLLSIQVLLKKK